MEAAESQNTVGSQIHSKILVAHFSASCFPPIPGIPELDEGQVHHYQDVDDRTWAAIVVFLPSGQCKDRKGTHEAHH